MFLPKCVDQQQFLASAGPSERLRRHQERPDSSQRKSRTFAMRATPIRVLPIALAALILVVPPARAEDGVTADKIVLGQAAALTGPAAALGQGMKLGLEAAFAEVNK